MQPPSFGNRTLHWVDYLIFGLTLLGSVAIGIYYAIRERHKTTEDYLIAGRKMSMLPAAISLMISYLSAVTLLGDAAENYFFGISYSLYIFSSFFFRTHRGIYFRSSILPFADHQRSGGRWCVYGSSLLFT